MNNERRQKTIAKRQAREKEKFLEQLKKMPIVRVACERSGISHASYYRWLEDDKDFAEGAAEAMDEGAEYVSDMAETQQITLIKDKYWPAIRHWLEHRSSKYVKKVNVQGKVDVDFSFDQPQ